MNRAPQFQARIVRSREVVSAVASEDARVDTTLPAEYWARRWTVELLCVLAPGPILVTLKLEDTDGSSLPTQLLRFTTHASCQVEFQLPESRIADQVRIRASSYMASNPREVWTQVLLLEHET